MLKRSRDVEIATTSAIVSTLATGTPVSPRNSASIAIARVDGSLGSVDDPRQRDGADEEHVEHVGHLRLRHVHRRRGLVVDSAVPHVGHDADDLALGFTAEDRNTAADQDPLRRGHRRSARNGPRTPD